MGPSEPGLGNTDLIIPSSPRKPVPPPKAHAPARRIGWGGQSRAWLPGLCAALGGVVVLWALALPLNEGLRADELTSVFRYVGGGPSAMWGHYIPNDHILFELLTWMFRAITGDHSQAVIRFWSVIPAIAAVVSLAWWLWRRLDPWVAALFVVLVAAAPVYQDLASEGRGYGLGFLAAALTLIGADTVARGGGRRGLTLFAVGSLVGIFTLPVFVLPVVALSALLWFARAPRRDLLVAVALVALASLLFYAPVLSDLLKASGQQDGQQLGLAGFVTGPLRDQLQPSVQALLSGVSRLDWNTYASHVYSNAVFPSSFGAELVAASALAAGVAVLVSRRERVLAGALLIPVTFSYLALEVLRAYVISRFASYLLLPLLILCAAGLVGAARMVARTRMLAVVLAAGGFAFSVFALDRAYKLATIGGAQVRTLVSNAPAPFQDYIASSSITLESPSQLQTLFCTERTSFVYLGYDGGPQPSASAQQCLHAREGLKIPFEHHRVGGAVWVAQRPLPGS